MIYYDQPTKFAPGLEAIIVNAVHEIIPAAFGRSQFPNPEAVTPSASAVLPV